MLHITQEKTKYFDPTDYYGILGIEKTANKKAIKDAFKKLAKEYHPDLPEGDADIYRVIKEAYECLMNDERRFVYDTAGFSEPELRKALSEIINGIITCYENDITHHAEIKKKLIIGFETIIRNNKTRNEEFENKIEVLDEIADSIESNSYIMEIMRQQLESKRVGTTKSMNDISSAVRFAEACLALVPHLDFKKPNNEWLEGALRNTYGTATSGTNSTTFYMHTTI